MRLAPLDLGGKSPHRGWPKSGLYPIRTRLSKVGRTPHKEGVLGESFPTKGGVLEGLHPPLFRPRALLATYIMRGGGGGAAHLIPKAYAPPSLSLNPAAPLLDLGLDVVLDRNSL